MCGGREIHRIGIGQAIGGSARDLAPILLVVLLCQLAVLRQPLPNLAGTGVGILLVLLGLTFILKGLEQGLLLLGESIATAFARKGSLSGCWPSLSLSVSVPPSPRPP